MSAGRGLMTDFEAFDDTRVRTLSMAEVSEGIIAGQSSPVIVLRDEIPPARPGLNLHGLVSAASNLGLAALFFSELFRGSFAHANSLTNFIWIDGAALMGLFALVRVAPKTELVSLSTITATGGMMLIPAAARSPSLAPAVGSIAAEKRSNSPASFSPKLRVFISAAALVCCRPIVELSVVDRSASSAIRFTSDGCFSRSLLG